MKIKGMRDIQTRTVYGRVNRVIPRTRAQVVAELAYLENEKDRIERELGLGCQTETDGRPVQLRQRISVLQGILRSSRRTIQRPSTTRSHERGRQARYLA